MKLASLRPGRDQ